MIEMIKVIMIKMIRIDQNDQIDQIDKMIQMIKMIKTMEMIKTDFNKKILNFRSVRINPRASCKKCFRIFKRIE